MTESNAPYRRLYRSSEGRMLAGVCAGLADYLRVDVNALRVIWLLSVFFSGVGLLAYLVAWILIPEDPEAAPPHERPDSGSDPAKILGVVLIAIALVWLAGRLGLFIPWRWIVPAGLVALGLTLLIRPQIQRAAEKQSEEAVRANEAKQDDAGGAAEAGRPPLVRSKRDRVFFGVCGGLAKRWKMDSTVIRLLWILLTVFGLGLLVIVYLVMALIVPEEEDVIHGE